MIFEPTPLAGAVLVRCEPATDERGLFARTWCRQEFTANGLSGALEQCNISSNRRQGTLRGMHFQAPPHGEDKLVRCTRGAIFDVVVDLRPDSPTRGRWWGVELTVDNLLALFIPSGFAHGFITLRDDTDVFYQMSVPFVPGAARGFRWNDPTVGIAWPGTPAVISERDRTLPDFDSLGLPT